MSNKTGLIIISDILTDTDDVGGIAIAASHRRPVYGLISSTNAENSAGALAVLDNHYGLGAWIGWDKKGTAPGSRDPYTSNLVSEYDLGDKSRIVSAKRAFNRALRDAREDGNDVEVVSLGSLGTMSRLIGNKKSQKLVNDVVTGTTIMGGDFATRASEYNIRLDIAAANNVARNWSGRKNWVGFEQGKDILTGAVLADRPGPVRRAYQLYPAAGGTGKIGNTRSWDKVAMAAFYRPGLFNQRGPIDLSFGSTGNTVFSVGGTSKNYYLQAPDQGRVTRYINKRLSRS